MSVVSTVPTQSPTRTQFTLDTAPGHLIRRAHQLAVAMFAQTCADFDLTPVQFGALTAIAQQSGIDQASLAAYLAFDAVTVGSVLQRLEAKQLITRTVDASDKRKRCLKVTAAANVLLSKITPHANAAQGLILSPLNATEQPQLMALLGQLVKGLEAQQVHNKAAI